MRVLLSIKPQYANKIFEGSKRFEFRKAIHKNPNVKVVVVYATKPVGKVIGEFTVSDVHSDSPRRLWRKTKSAAGITERFFTEYFAGREIGFAIEVAQARLYDEPLELTDFVASGFAPQSFVYLAAT